MLSLCLLVVILTGVFGEEGEAVVVVMVVVVVVGVVVGEGGVCLFRS